MLWNYLKTTLRNLKRHKLFSIINIAGLAVGLACCILIIQYVRFERSFDDFNIHKDRIFRIVNVDDPDQKDEIGVLTSAPIGPALKLEFPEIEHFVRIQAWRDILLHSEDKKFFEKVYWADKDFFKIFTYPLAEGDAESVLQNPFSMVISERMALKYFGNDDPIGKTIYFNQDEDTFPFKVTGVVKNVPDNSTFQFDFLLSFASLATISGDWINTNWGSFNYHTFILLNQKTTASQFDEKLPFFFKKFMGDHYSYWGEPIPRFFLQPLGEIHLHSHSFFEIETNGHIQDIYLYSVLGLFILLLACFNYINLSTAQYTKRFMEVGVRKVVGATRKTLIAQFMGESIVIAFIAMISAIFLAELLLPAFNALVNRPLTFDIFSEINLAAFSILVLIVGLMAGFYPALYLSKFRSISILKKTVNFQSAKLNSRNILVFVQFSITIILLASVLLVSNQIHFMITKTKGYESDQIVSVELRDQHIKDSYMSIKSELLKNPDILNVSGSEPPSAIDECRGGVGWEGKTEDMNVPMYRFGVTSDFNDLYKLELKEGRFFSDDYATDRQAVILNESAVRAIGWESALNKKFDDPVNGASYVIGVLKDFHFHSLHERISPLYFVMRKNASSLSIKIKPKKVRETINNIKATYDRFHPRYPFTFSFLEDEFIEMYRSEYALNSVLKFFTALAILIAGFGLFGLALFTTERRTKEIGIRIVIGASVKEIIIMLTTDFTRWVLLANIVAWPVAYYAMNKWLQNFAYRIEMSLWMFALAGGVALLIALLTVSCQAVRAARANPVESLRYE